MRDIVSRITFGFLMAQLFPGALLTFSVCLFYFSLPPSVPASLYQAANIVLTVWETGTLTRSLVIVGVIIAAGMLIHGLNWAVLGSLEKRFNSVFDSYWHDKAIWLQMLAGPVKIVRELFGLLGARGIRGAGIKEKIPKIAPARVPNLQILEEFYLSSAQFFLHTAYALLGSLFSVAGFTLVAGVTSRRIVLLVVLYLLTGIFFVLGRIQLQSLFQGECDLAESPAAEPSEPAAP